MKFKEQQFDEDWEEIEPRVRISEKNATPLGKAIIIQQHESLGKAYMRHLSNKATIEDLKLLSRYPKFAITNKHYRQAAILEDRISLNTILEVMSRADLILDNSHSKFRKTMDITHGI